MRSSKINFISLVGASMGAFLYGDPTTKPRASVQSLSRALDPTYDTFSPAKPKKAPYARTSAGKILNG